MKMAGQSAGGPIKLFRVAGQLGEKDADLRLQGRDQSKKQSAQDGREHQEAHHDGEPARHVPEPIQKVHHRHQQIGQNPGRHEWHQDIFEQIKHRPENEHGPEHGEKTQTEHVAPDHSGQDVSAPARTSNTPARYIPDGQRIRNGVPISNAFGLWSVRGASAVDSHTGV